jgi:hypothetical protein
MIGADLWARPLNMSETSFFLFLLFTTIVVGIEEWFFLYIRAVERWERFE